MKRALLLLISFLLLNISAGAQSEAIILDQTDLPVTIEEYSAKYKRHPTPSGIEHEVTIKNVVDVDLVAIEVAFVSFDAFDEFLHFGIGFSRPGIGFTETEKNTWKWSPLYGFKFYTGIAFIRRMRFANGEIWHADTEAVAQQIRDLFGFEVEPDSIQPADGEGEGDVFKI